MCGKRVDNTGHASPNVPAHPDLLTDDMIHIGPSVAYSPHEPAPPTSFFPWTIPTNPRETEQHDALLGYMAGIRPDSSSSPPLFQGYHQLRGLQLAIDRPDFFSAGMGMIYGGTDRLSCTFRSCSSPPSFGVQADMAKLTAQEIMDAKALAASKNHSEAERRRRGRINGHLDKLRTLLPSTTKTDKASLLAEVIQHVKELKRQTSQIAESNPVPTEVDEVMVYSDESCCADGKLVIKASICCEDRSDLLADLIKTLKSLRLRTLKADITTLGGRVRNVLVVTAEEGRPPSSSSLGCIQEALKAVMERQVISTSGHDVSNSVKRQRTNLAMFDHKSI